MMKRNTEELLNLLEGSHRLSDKEKKDIRCALEMPYTSVHTAIRLVNIITHLEETVDDLEYELAEKT